MPDIPWPPPFPPLPPLPLPLVIVGLLVIGFAVWIFARLVLRPAAFRIPRLGPGRVAVLTGDGGLHIAGFPETPPESRPSTTLTWSRTLRAGDTEEGGNRGYWDLKQLTLSADQKLLAELSIEPVGTSEIDYWVDLWDVERGVKLFSASDNFVPRVTVQGDDPNPPPPVKKLYEEIITTWQANGSTPPKPDPIYETYGDYGGNRMEIAGWTTDGRLAVTGVCFWIEAGNPPDPDQEIASDEQPWWGIVDPAAPRSFEYYPTGIGPLPASYSLVPEPRPLRILTLTNPDYDRNGTLFVDGVEQTANWLASRVKGFSGPFKA